MTKALAPSPWNDPTLAWVCEKHPDRIPFHDDCPGPGMLARDAIADAQRRAQLKGRRHHNNTGYRQIREGKTCRQVDAIARRVLGPATRKP